MSDDREIPPPPDGEGDGRSKAIASASSSTTLNPRLAPQDLGAEQSILGGILLDNDLYFEVVEHMKPSDFYREPHRTIFVAMQSMALADQKIDILTLGDQLRKQGQLEQVGGPAYLGSLDAMVPATANLGRYAKIVRAHALRREILVTLHTLAREGYEALGEVDAYLEKVQTTLFNIGATVTEGDFKSGSAVITGVFNRLNELYERKLDVIGISTGLQRVDRITSGLQAGNLIIIAGRPSMGKTAFALGIAGHVADVMAQDHQGVAAVVSLEMTDDELGFRDLSMRSGVDLKRLRSGKVNDPEWSILARTADTIARSDLFIDDGSSATVTSIRAKLRRLVAMLAKQGKKLALLVIDYLQLMRGAKESDTRDQEIGDITKGLKAIAKDFAIPVIALSQLNRDLERREDKRPKLSDLRESGNIEQDADVIVFLYRDEVYNAHTNARGVAEVIVGKQRNGPTGMVPVAFDRSCARFRDMTDEESREHDRGD